MLRSGRELLPAAVAACYSVHLPLCGHPSRPIVVQKMSLAHSLWLRGHSAKVTATTADTSVGRTAVKLPPPPPPPFPSDCICFVSFTRWGKKLFVRISASWFF